VVDGGEQVVGKRGGRLTGGTSAETQKTVSAREEKSRTRAQLKGVQQVAGENLGEGHERDARRKQNGWPASRHITN